MERIYLCLKKYVQKKLEFANARATLLIVDKEKKVLLLVVRQWWAVEGMTEGGFVGLEL
jgi:hypothetical protein